MNYRLEYALLALALLAVLHWAYLQGELDLGLAIFFAIMPDFAFIPMLPYMKRGSWPTWGASLYNFTHSYLVFGVVFAAAYALQLPILWPLLGLPLHISADRALGLALRDKK